MGQDQGQGRTRDSAPTSHIPPAPSRPATKAPLEEIPPPGMVQDQGKGITDESTSTFRIPPAQARPTTTNATLPEIPLLKKGVDEGKGITQDSTSSFLSLPGQSMLATPDSRRKGSPHTHHHWRSWAAPHRKRIPGQRSKHRKDGKGRHEAIMTAAKDNMNKLAKVIVTATNMHAAAMMTSASIVAQALDRQTDAIKAREPISPQEPALQSNYESATL